jgi:hypothetical protein
VALAGEGTDANVTVARPEPIILGAGGSDELDGTSA